ncbi:MAG: anthranilate synthase component I family protein, partial [Pseudomonadota bacterium]
MPTFIQKLSHGNAASYFSTLAREPHVVFLDSADRKHPGARYSFIAWDPVEVITIEDCGPKNPFVHLQSRIDHWNKKLKPEHNPGIPPFQGGAAGLFSYDLGRALEKLPNTATSSDTPDLAIGIYNKVIAIDHETDEAWLISHGTKATLPETASLKPQTSSLTWEAQFSKDAFKARVARVIEYIRAGDIFQANISQRFTAALPEEFDSAAHYLHLREINPAPFAGYMNLGDTQISSASPERFLKVTDKQVETKPIKGTAPAHTDPKILLSSEKDRAENIMIVDLLRNDLSKVCEIDSIEVSKLCALETFKGVHHLVSTVTGTLKTPKYRNIKRYPGSRH